MAFKASKLKFASIGTLTSDVLRRELIILGELLRPSLVSQLFWRIGGNIGMMTEGGIKSERKFCYEAT